MIFTEFLSLVETKFGAETVDLLLDSVETTTNGAYTAVGSYDANELAALVTKLSDVVNVPLDDLLEVFGFHLFGRLAQRYPEYVDRATGAFEFLKRLNDYVHVEVRKLYPDAELPRFKWELKADNELVLHYESERPFARVALGLIKGCLQSFEESADVDMETLGPDGCRARFAITTRDRMTQ